MSYKRKHVRTRFTDVGHADKGGITHGALKPGTYRIHTTQRLPEEYVGSFIVRRDGTVALYGDKMKIIKDH